MAENELDMADQDPGNDPENLDALPELPAWLREWVPEPRELLSLDYADGVYSIAGRDFPTLDGAYDWACSENLNFDISPSIPGEENGWVFGPVERALGGRLYFSSTDQDKMMLLQYAYQEFLQAAEGYLANPTDFLRSYRFLDHHPAFWVREDRPRRGQREELNPTWDWKTGGHAMALWQCPMALGPQDSEEQRAHYPLGYSWAMEAGGHVLPGLQHHYHDLRLDVYGTSLEDAHTQLAALVHKFFNLDGTEREGVEYEKSELELTLEARMNSLQELLEDVPQETEEGTHGE